MIALPLAYAEIHYSPAVIPNILRRKEPEIVLDVPHRVEPRQKLPILLLVKDAHRHPVRLLEVQVTLRVPGFPEIRQVFELGPQTIDTPWYWQVLFLEPPAGAKGLAHVLPEIRVEVGESLRTYAADNYRRTSHSPFEVYLAEEGLPYPSGWFAGDLHTHSHLTADQVEFGSPWEPTIVLARAAGLHWFAITDHSYDLDDHPDDPLTHHRDFPKWRLLWAELDRLQTELQDFVVLPGEELSVGNRRGRNVHLLIVGSRRFFAGDGDSAERWLRTKPQHLLPEVLDQVGEEPLVAAAHPGSPVPFLEWLLLRRGKWSLEDLSWTRLDGLQCLNGDFDASFDRALALWVQLLVAGRRLGLLAGNDAHGNFGRFRQIGLPFVSMREGHRQLFGRAKTVVRLDGPPTREELLRQLRRARAVITDGPFVEIRGVKGDGSCLQAGEAATERPRSLYVYAASTPEFGYVREIRLWLGRSSGETLYRILRPNRLVYRFETELPFPPHQDSGYVRASLFTRERGDHFALTNPIWFS
ncbi:MAG: CehA/McbA family metallohydrolase [candidate division KSB1 bacterium]|nr:CehA/McbA family metallohydrolase [candidate division KSB1 bacterium]